AVAAPVDDRRPRHLPLLPVQQQRRLERPLAIGFLDLDVLERRDVVALSLLDLEIGLAQVPVAQADAGFERVELDQERAADATGLLRRGADVAAERLRLGLEAAADRERAH